MGYRFNALTAQLDLVGNSSGPTSGVVRVGSTLDKSISRWFGNDTDSIQGSNTLVQDGGAIEAEGYIGRKSISNLVTLPSDHYMIATGLTITTTGSLVINSDSELVLI